MKKSQINMTIAKAMMSMVLFAAGAFALPLEYWTFDDAADKTFNTVVNSGSLNSVWNNGGVATMKTDGFGNLVVSNHVGQTYRKVPKAGTANANATLDEYAAPLTSGVYRLEMDLTSWALDSSAATGGTLTYSALSAGASGTVIAGIRLRILDATTGRLQLFTDLAGTAQGFRNFDFGLTNTVGITAMIEFDFDADTVTYYTNGVQTHSFTDFEATQLTTIQFNTDNNWISTSVVTIDSMLFEAGDPPTDVYIASKGYFTAAATAPSTNSISFSVLEGDVVAFLAASNKGTDSSTNSVTFSGTATLDPVAYDRRLQGASTFCWYTRALSGGTVDVELITSNSYVAAAGYLLRAPDGETVTLLDTSKNGGSDLESITNTYTGGEASGIFLEAFATYGTAGTPLNPDTIVDSSQVPARFVAHGVFTNANPLVNVWTNTTGHVAIIGLLFDSVATSVITPTSLWNDWISGYPGVGANSGLQDQGDSDSLDNLTEYAFGGDPSDGNNLGNTPVQSQVASGGTNYIEYIYFERNDAATRGLASVLEVGTDLVYTNWADGSSYEMGSGASAVTGYNAVTNRIPTDAEARQFIRLQIQFTP